MSTVTELVLSIIRSDGGTQPRVELNQEVIEEYAEALHAGAVFPPVTVFYDGTSYWLADGFHRVEAAKSIGTSTITAEVHQGNLREAVLHSAGVNAAHGLRRSNEDKRRAVATLLHDAEWSQWSDREIARHAGVSDRFVNNLSKELTANRSQSHCRRGADRRIINTTKIGKGRKSQSAEPSSEGSDASPPGETTTPISPAPEASTHPQSQNEAAPVAELEAEVIPAEDPTAESNQPQAGLPEKEAPASYQIGDRVRILHRQHGEDKWMGESGKIWAITSDDWLRVDVEGYKGVRFTLHPDWVERMIEQPSEPPPEQPEPAMPQTTWADEPDPETPALAEGSSEREAPLQLQAGDRLQVTKLGKQNQKWTGEVAEVLEVTETEIMVNVRVPHQPS